MSSESTQDELRKSSISSLTSLIGLQLFSRLFTFGLNQALVRLTSPEIFGAAAIQFELILSTILFLSREGVRTTILRAKSPGSTTLNLTFLPIGVGIPLASVVAYLYDRYAKEELRTRPCFRAAVGVYVLAAVVELLTEPYHNWLMVELKTNVRVRAEGSGIIAKSVATFLVLLYDSRRGEREGSLALLAFALGQLAYSSTCLGVYVASLGILVLIPRKARSAFVDPRLFRLSITMTMQSIIKHILTEGDKLILSSFSPLQDQGGYALAVNYGSLIARIIFQPIEEVMRLYFSRTAAQDANNKDGLQKIAHALVSLVSTQMDLSLFFLVFGTSYSPILLPVILPPRYMATSAPQILTAWVWYIPVLAVNGGLEGFVASVASAHALNKQNRWMVVFSALFIVTAISLYQRGFGDSSLVYANIVNLMARIAFAVAFTNSFFASKGAPGLFPLRSLFPRPSVILMSLAVWLVVRWSAESRNIQNVVNRKGRASVMDLEVIQHISIGTALAVVWLSCWWLVSGRSWTVRPWNV